MPTTAIPTDRHWFQAATEGVLSALARIPEDRFASPGLGEWTIRDLAGHTSRAWITVATYLDPDRQVSDPDIDSAARYFSAARAALADPSQVLRRGREAGHALGDDPVARAGELAATGLTAVAAATDDARVATPVGVMRLADYLPTRAFELTVHGLDLCAAASIDVPPRLDDAAAPALRFAVELCSSDERRSLLSVLTGRRRADAAAVPTLSL